VKKPPLDRFLGLHARQDASMGHPAVEPPSRPNDDPSRSDADRRLRIADFGPAPGALIELD
jgi:hypothetical protein